MSSQENIKKLVQEFGYSRSFLSAKFNVDQLSVGREAFISMLSKSLENVDE